MEKKLCWVVKVIQISELSQKSAWSCYITGWEKQPLSQSFLIPSGVLTIQILIKTHTKMFKK
jgi:hypothetical protein